MIRKVLLLLGAAALLFFILRIDYRGLARIRLHFDWPFFLLGMTLVLANLAIKAIRWKLLLDKQNETIVSFPFALYSVVAGVAASSLTPGRLLDAGKPLLYRDRYGGSIAQSVLATLVERLMDLAALAVLFAIAALLVGAGEFLRSLAMWILLFLILAAVALFLFAPAVSSSLAAGLLRLLPLAQPTKERLAEKTRELFSCSASNWARISPVLFLLSLTALGIEIARIYAVFRSFGLTVAPGALAFAFLGAVLIGLMLLIPGGVGVTETSTAGLLARFGLASSVMGPIQAAVLADRILSYYLLVPIGSLILLASRGAVRNKTKEAKAVS